MKINFYFYLFLLVSSILAIIFFPTDTELIYVFQKSKNLPKLKVYYEKKLEKNYDNNTAFKYLTVLKELRDKSFFSEADKFLKKYKNKKIIDDAINLSLLEKDFKKYVEWLNKGYVFTSNIKYLEKLLNYYSYIHNEEQVLNILKKLYFITKEEKYLDELYGMGETDFVINQYLKDERLAFKNINRILDFFINRKNYKDYIKFLEKAYTETKDISYLIKKKEFYSFIQDKKNLVKALKQLYAITKSNKYLDELYNIGEKNYVISIYEKNFDKLNPHEKRKLLQYYIWQGKNRSILSLIESFIKSGIATDDDEERYVNLLLYYQDYNKVIKFYISKFEKTKSWHWLEKLADIYNYYGFPEKACDSYFRLFKITGKEKYLNLIINIYTSLNDYKNFLKFSLIKLKNFYSEKSLKQLAYFLIENRMIAKAIRLTERYYQNDDKLFHFLISLYFMDNRYKKALKLMLSKKPEGLNCNELNFIATYEPMNSKFIPYIEKYYEITKNKYFIIKILKYYAKNMAFYSLNRYFKKYFGKINENNFYIYFEAIPNRLKTFKRKEAIRLGIASFNINLLNRLAIYLMGLGEQKNAAKIFEKVLFLDEKNLVALESFGKLLYWQNNFDKALNLFLKYDILNPKNPVIKFYIGEIYWNRKNFSLAKHYLKFVVKNIKKDTLEKHMIYLKAYVLLYGIDDVLDEYRGVVATNKGNTDIYADFIDALYFSKKYNILKKEFEAFQSMPDKYRNNVRLLRLFAMYNIEVANFKKAYSLLKKAYRILFSNNSINSTILADFGYYYLAKGDKVKSLEYYEKALNIDKKNKELKKIVKKLKYKLTQNVVLKYEYKNKVKIAGIDINYPYKRKVWIGFGYKIYEYDISEIFLKLQDINQILYKFEVGKNHFCLETGKNYNFFLKHNIFEDYPASIDEKMTQTKVGFSISENIKKLSFNISSAKNFYRNRKGKVSETFSADISTSFLINNSSYLTAGFSYVKLNYYNTLKSDVFFDDYRAVSLFYSKDYTFKNNEISFHYGVGGIYDLILEKLNYSVSVNFNYKNRFFVEYTLYYDTFSREQVDMFKMQLRINF